MQRSFIFAGGQSTRYHTADVLHRQSIADHSFGVAWFCELATDGKASKDLIMAALAHDLAEHRVGDIPSPAKRALNVGAQFAAYERSELMSVELQHYEDNLSVYERNILKFADMLDGMQFCLHERKRGNRNVDIIYERFTSYVGELLRATGSSRDFYNHVAGLYQQIMEEWEGVTK